MGGEVGGVKNQHEVDGLTISLIILMLKLLKSTRVDVQVQ